MIKKQNRWWLCTWLIEDDDPQTPSQPPQPQTEIVSSAVNIQLCSDPNTKTENPPRPGSEFLTLMKKKRDFWNRERDIFNFPSPSSSLYLCSSSSGSHKKPRKIQTLQLLSLKPKFWQKNKRYHSRIRLIFMTGKQSSNIFLAYVMLSIEFPNFQ